MRVRFLVAAVLMAIVAAACGSRLSDEVLQRIDQQELRGATSGDGESATADSGPSAGPQAVDGGSVAAPEQGGATPVTGPAAATGPAAGQPQGPVAQPVPGQAAPTTAVAAAAGGACRGGATDKGVSASEIKLGSMSTDSGPLPGATAGTFRGAASYLAMINAQGGVCGRRLTLLKGDDGLDPARGRSEFLRLEPQVLAFVGNLAVADSGYLDVIKRTGVPYIGTTVDPAGRDYPNVWPKIRTDLINTGPFAYVKRAYPNVSKVGYMLTAVEGVRVNSPGFEAALKRVGFDIRYRAEANPAAPEYTAHIINMQQEGVEFVYLFAFEINMQVRLARNMRQQNFDPPVKMGQLAYNTKFFELLGDVGNGWKSHLAFLPVLDRSEGQRAPGLGRFLEWNARLFPRDQLDLFPVFGWGDADLFIEALKKLGPEVTRQKLIAALGTVNSTDALGVEAPSNPVTGEASLCFVMVKGDGGRWVREHPPGGGFECKLGENFKWK